MSNIRAVISIITIPLWVASLLLLVSVLSYVEDNPFLYVLFGALTKICLWLSGFYDWHSADMMTRKIRFSRATKNVWNIE